MTEHDRQARHLVVLGDSLSSFAPDQRFRPHDTDLFAERLRSNLEQVTGKMWTVDLLAQTWWSVRAAATEIKSSELSDRIRAADAVVVGLATADMLPVIPFTRKLLRGPTTVTTHRPILRGVRPPWLRRILWGTFSAFHLAGVRVSSGRFRHTSSRRLALAWPDLISTIRRLCPGAAICAVLPSVGRDGEFVWPTPHRQEVAMEIATLARAANVPVVDLALIVRPWVKDLPDGTHWHYPVHTAVAQAFTEVLAPTFQECETSD